MNLTLLIILSASLIIFTLLCVLMRSLLKAAIALSIVSALLTVAMFILGATLAAVFELSVCTGLITVTFVSAISLTRTETEEEAAWKPRERFRRFVFLPIIIIIVFAAMVWILWPYIDFSSIDSGQAESARAQVQQILWNERKLDVMGQIAVVLAGVFGIVILYRERERK